jgi:ribonuclease HI
LKQHEFLKIVTDAHCPIPDAHLAGHSGRAKAHGGIIFLDGSGNTVDKNRVALGELTVPQAEYKALIYALGKASAICEGKIDVWMDSELVVKQLNGEDRVKSPNMKPLHHEVKNLEGRFERVRYSHHLRTAPLAKKADQLARGEHGSAE